MNKPQLIPRREQTGLIRGGDVVSAAEMIERWTKTLGEDKLTQEFMGKMSLFFNKEFPLLSWSPVEFRPGYWTVLALEHKLLVSGEMGNV